MGTPVKANIIKSGAKLYIAPLGTTPPDESSVGADVAWPAPWARVGFTSEATVFLYEDERMDIKTEEILGAIAQKRIGEKVTVETSLAELTGDYMKFGTDGTLTTTPAGAGQIGYENLAVGNNGEVTEYAIGIEGLRYNTTLMHIRILMASGTIALRGGQSFSRRSDDYVNMPIRVQGLADASTGKMFDLQRQTAAASS